MIAQKRENIRQLEHDNTSRRQLLQQTQQSLNELGHMLTEMKHTTEQLRNIFYEQEKKIEFLRRELSAAEDQQRQKSREQAELTAQLH